MGTVPDTRAKAHGPRLPTHAFSCARRKRPKTRAFGRGDGRTNENDSRERGEMHVGFPDARPGEFLPGRKIRGNSIFSLRQRVFHAFVFAPRAINKI